MNDIASTPAPAPEPYFSDVRVLKYRVPHLALERVVGELVDLKSAADFLGMEKLRGHLLSLELEIATAISFHLEKFAQELKEIENEEDYDGAKRAESAFCAEVDAFIQRIDGV